MNKLTKLEAREWVGEPGYGEYQWIIANSREDLAVYKVTFIFELMQEKINELVQECNELRSTIEQSGFSSFGARLAPNSSRKETS